LGREAQDFVLRDVFCLLVVPKRCDKSATSSSFDGVPDLVFHRPRVATVDV